MDDTPDYIDISEKGAANARPKPGSWGSMNAIQKTGVISSVVLYVASLPSEGIWGTIFGLSAWTALFLGYVAGNLWKYRHALHFWWSLAFACVVHVALLPVFVNLVRSDHKPHAGKEYMLLSVYLVCAEVILLLFVLKRFAMWLHRRLHEPQQDGVRHV